MAVSFDAILTDTCCGGNCQCIAFISGGFDIFDFESLKVGSESNTEAPFVPSTTTEPIPTTFRRRRPKIKPIETFDGVSIKQINKLQKNVESVPELEPLVRDQNKVNLHDVVLGTFENIEVHPTEHYFKLLLLRTCVPAN